MVQATGLIQEGLFSTSKLLETFERIRLTTDVDQSTWHEVMQMPAKDYFNLRTGKTPITEKVVERVSDHFELNITDLLKGRIDFTQLALKYADENHELPEVYSKAAFGRKRTSITSMNFLEKYIGWRIRLDAMKNLGVNEKDLQDPFSPISMKFITDLCSYLHTRQFSDRDLISMGAFSYEGNKNSVVAQLYSDLSTATEAYEFFFNDCMKLFEQNCFYKITQSHATGMTVNYITNPHVAAESGVAHLGNEHVCQLKIGIISNITCYIGLPASQIQKIACVHKGDSVCTLDITYPKARIYRRA